MPLDRLPSGGDVIINITVNGDLRADDEDSIADTLRRSLWVAGLNRGLGMGRLGHG